jgi:hypothetical protein
VAAFLRLSLVPGILLSSDLNTGYAVTNRHNGLTDLSSIVPIPEFVLWRLSIRLRSHQRFARGDCPIELLDRPDYLWRKNPPTIAITTF